MGFGKSGELKRGWRRTGDMGAQSMFPRTIPRRESFFFSFWSSVFRSFEARDLSKVPRIPCRPHHSMEELWNSFHSRAISEGEIGKTGEVTDWEEGVRGARGGPWLLCGGNIVKKYLEFLFEITRENSRFWQPPYLEKSSFVKRWCKIGIPFLSLFAFLLFG